MKIKQRQIKNLIVGLVAVLAILLVINTFLTKGLDKEVDIKLALAKELAKPAVIQLTTIQGADCDNCFNITPVVNSIKRGNVNVTKEDLVEFGSDEAKELIITYEIEKLPVVLIFGEIDKIKKSGFSETEGALVFTSLTPPYTNAVSGEIEGLVSVTYLEEPSCEECVDLEPVIAQLRQAGVEIIDQENVEVGSEKGKELIKKYDISKAPTILLSGDIAVYDAVVQAWAQVGTVEDDGTYVTRLVNAPYFNVQSNQIEGLVDLTMLTDSSCEECYNVTMHKLILGNFGMKFDDEELIDISDKKGKELIERYDISAVPTVILSKDAGAYFALKEVWPEVGTVEDDGSYVFRELDVLQVPYKDLSTNEITGLVVSE